MRINSKQFKGYGHDIVSWSVLVPFFGIQSRKSCTLQKEAGKMGVRTGVTNVIVQEKAKSIRFVSLSDAEKRQEAGQVGALDVSWKQAWGACKSAVVRNQQWILGKLGMLYHHHIPFGFYGEEKKQVN